MRILLAALLVAGLPTPAPAAPPCKDARGKFVACPKPATTPRRCKGANGKFVKCGTPGAKPV